jgi:hypothetical protein
VDPTLARTEVVALLTAIGAVYAAPAGEDQQGCPVSAAEAALALARAAGDCEVSTAAVTLANDVSESVSPSLATCLALAELDPELPIVVKQLGRWVMLPLSQLRPPA